MLQRSLARENVDERPRELLAASGIRSYRQLLQRPLWDVAHAADVSVDEIMHLISKVSMRLAPRVTTAFEMFMESVNRPLFLRTGLPLVDAALCGGFHCGALHEFAGSSGIGKTQFAMTMAVNCALEYPHSRVLYFDTERGFSPKRVEQITRARLRFRYSGIDDAAALDEHVNSVMHRILVHRTDSLSVFLNRLKEMDTEVPARQVKLIIVDSIASLLVKAHDLTFAQRENHVQRIARQLKYIGDVHQAFVVVTNRATTVDSEFSSFTKPLLGDTWAHCVTSRFVLERHAAFRVISLIKCPSADHVIQPFEISEIGVEPVQETSGMSSRHPVENAFEDDFAIHDDVLRDLDLTGLPDVDPSATLRSTQQSDADADDTSEHDDDSQQQQPSTATAASMLPSDDIVCDSNDESGSDDNGGSDRDRENSGWFGEGGRFIGLISST